MFNIGEDTDVKNEELVHGCYNCPLFIGFVTRTSCATLGLWYSLILNEPSWVKAGRDVAGGAFDPPIYGEWE